jgi:hypothetical protein
MNALKIPLSPVYVTLTTVSIRLPQSQITEYTVSTHVSISYVKRTGIAAPKDTDTTSVSVLVAGRSQRDASRCTAPTTNLTARTSNLQNIKDKHSDQKRAP